MEILVEKRGGENREIKQKSAVKNPAAPKRRRNQKRQKSKSDPSRMDDAIPIYDIRSSDISKFQPIKKHNCPQKRRIDRQLFSHFYILS